MPKKRVKKKRFVSGEVDLKKIEEKLDRVLSLEKKQLEEVKDFEDLEMKQLEKGKEFGRLEERQLEELENLEKRIRRQAGPKILSKITYRDITKAFVGAFIAIISHFAFFKGAEIAEHISNSRAVLLFLFSYFVGFVFIYSTGFRKVKQRRLLTFIPLRITIIYFVSLFVIFIVLSVFELAVGSGLLFRQIAVISLPAIIGACAADLIGGVEYVKEKAD
jgi:uncharacterized membrane protein